MFGSSMLDIAIGVVFTFLLVSVFATVINELIVSILSLRGRFLLRGIKSMLDDPKATGLAKAVYEHGQVYGLYEDKFDPARTKRNLPSYIPAKNFALALIDVVLQDQNTPTAAQAPAVDPPLPIPPANPQAALVDQVILVSQDFKAAASALACNPVTAKVGKPLVAMIDMAGGDVAKLQTAIEAWFNSAMDRVSGWYKARTQWILFGLGIVLAVVMNADTIHIIRQLSSDQTLRQSIVAAAQTAKPPQTTAGQDVKVQIDGATSALKDIHSIGVPLGWSFTAEELAREKGRYLRPIHAAEARVAQYPGILIGWLLTAIAISLGAPFWFDALNKIMVIRSTVKPAEKSPLEASKS